MTPMSDANQFVSTSPKKDVVAAVQEGERAKAALAREQRTRKQLAIATGGMGAEVIGSIAGGAAVGYMQANDHEEWIAIAAAGLGVAMGMKRLDEPNNMYYQVFFAAANGMGAALAAGYSRDYFSQGGKPAPMT